jgi:hypothetical protein
MPMPFSCGAAICFAPRELTALVDALMLGQADASLP